MGFLISLIAAAMIALSDDPKPKPQPCYPDTIRVLRQQILPDTTWADGGIPSVTYRIILCK